MDFYKSFLFEINKIQYMLNSKISLYFRELQQDNSISLSLMIIFIAFIYGTIHAMGPGHGKAIVSSYFLKSNKNYKSAFKMGYLISIIHAISAMSLTFIIYYLLHTVFSKTFNEATAIAMRVSAVMIIIVGIYLLYEAIYQKHGNCQMEKKSKNDFFVALSAGIVPCPGVMTVLFFSMALGKIIVGVLSAIAMSIGMGLTISLVATFVVSAKKQGGFIKKNEYLFEYISAILIICLGCFLFFVNTY
jgi:ABC-type nickel/cobalt efflux system permease component RcnA